MGLFSGWTDIEVLKRFPEILSPHHVKEVVATEKIHGTSVRIGAIDDVFRIGGRNQEFDFQTSNPSAGYGFMGWIHQQKDLAEKVRRVSKETGKDLIIYGEWHGNGIQKGIHYFPKENKDLRIFGARLNDEIQDWNMVANIANAIGIRTVPLLYRGVPDLAIFDQLRVGKSVVAEENGLIEEGNFAEGIVISAIPMAKFGERWLIAKHKHPKFEERISLQNEAKKPMEISSLAVAFVEEFWTEQRLEHVLSSLQEKGLDPKSSTSIGPAIKGMFDDVMKEGQPEWAALSIDNQKIVCKIHANLTKKLLEDYLDKNLVA